MKHKRDSQENKENTQFEFSLQIENYEILLLEFLLFFLEFKISWLESVGVEFLSFSNKQQIIERKLFELKIYIAFPFVFVMEKREKI